MISSMISVLINYAVLDFWPRCRYCSAHWHSHWFWHFPTWLPTSCGLQYRWHFVGSGELHKTRNNHFEHCVTL